MKILEHTHQFETEPKSKPFGYTLLSDVISSKVFHTDNMEALKKMKVDQFDLACVDPVYGIDGNSHRKNESRSKLTKSKKYPSALWDQVKTGDDFFTELFRVSKMQIVFGGNYFPSCCGTEFKTPRRNEYDQFLKDHPTNWIIWDKVNSTTSYNDCELIWISDPVPSEIFYFMWSGMMQGKSYKNGKVMNPHKHLNQHRIHPTEKPYEIYKFLHSKFSMPGSFVLDTHVGSGSQRIVCYQMGINYEGYEINDKYFSDQEQRFKEYLSQVKIFPHIR